MEPTIVPRYTNGPYCPTDAPDPSDSSAARVDIIPLRMGSPGLRVCTIQMESEGPSPRRTLTVYRIINPTSNPPMVGTRIVAIFRNSMFSECRIRALGEIRRF